MTTIADYSGRTVDLAAYQGVELGHEQLLRMALAEESHSGMIVAGIQKLVQRVVVSLLTERGSQRHFPEVGCDFLYDARTGRFQTDLDVAASFASAMVDVRKQIQAVETELDPDDERFGSIALEHVELIDDSVALYASLTSLAGSSVQVLLPIPVGIF